MGGSWGGVAGSLMGLSEGLEFVLKANQGLGGCRGRWPGLPSAPLPGATPFATWLGASSHVGQSVPAQPGPSRRASRGPGCPWVCSARGQLPQGGEEEPQADHVPSCQGTDAIVGPPHDPQAPPPSPSRGGWGSSVRDGGEGTGVQLTANAQTQVFASGSASGKTHLDTAARCANAGRGRRVGSWSVRPELPDSGGRALGWALSPTLASPATPGKPPRPRMRGHGPASAQG